MRSISRVADVSINTVSKLLVEAGEAALLLHDETVRNVKASRVQCDEIWSFCHAKQKNVSAAKKAPAKAVGWPTTRRPGHLSGSTAQGAVELPPTSEPPYTN